MGKRETKLLSAMRYLNEDDIRLMKSRVEEKGKDISSEELFRGLEDCYIWKEEWTRETGHMWTYYTLLKRTLGQDEYDFADTWDFSPVRLTNFSAKAIVKELDLYKGI